MTENVTPAEAPRAQERLRHIVESANIHAGDSVLDVGTGTGQLLPYLAEAAGRFGNIDAVDISAEMLAQAHRHHARLPLPVRFFLADVEADTILTLYDRIVLLDVLPHLKRPLETVMKLFHKNLAGGGTLTLAHSTGRETLNALARQMGSERMLPPASEMATRMADAGMRVDFVEDTPDSYIIRLRRH